MTDTNRGDPETIADNYRAAFREQQNSAAGEDPLFPGVHETVQRLAAGPDILLGIATGKSRRGVDRLLKRENFEGLFQTIQTADEHPSKPHPSMIQQASVETGVALAQIVMIGDTVYDIEMARSAGSAAIGVSWGYHDSADLIAAGADIMVDLFEDLPEAISTVLPTPAAHA